MANTLFIIVTTYNLITNGFLSLSNGAFIRFHASESAEMDTNNGVLVVELVL